MGGEQANESRSQAALGAVEGTMHMPLRSLGKNDVV